MSNDLTRASGLAVLAALAAGCATEPTYAPPERPSMAEICPIGEVRVCRNHYPSRLEREGDPPLLCICEAVRGVR